HSLLPPVDPMPPNFLLRSLRALPAVRHALRDCDLIHATVELYAPLAQLVTGDRPLIVTGHGSYVNLPRIRRWPVNMIYRRAFERAIMLCVSEYTASVVQEILPTAKTVVVHNAVDAARFQQKTMFVPEIPRPIVLATGGVKARKGTLELVQAMAQVRQQIPTVQCVVIGSKRETEYLQQVEAEIAGLGLEDCVHLPGFVDDDRFIGWYQAADVFALPSINAGWKFEGFGLVYLEASAAGLPVIGTRDCGAEAAIEHGKTGLLISQKKIAEELPAAILELLHNPQKSQAMGTAGREKALSQTWDHAAEQVIALYENSLR
ncbi:MAG: glycosyltransferase family 4 protein, partial [Anaerolineae bacterium]|nr:glycosyltransferase family 4 protein [Anaerolineae bacterium]